jgi:pSer/pThr/pTyr-binding forkhead associated (FHA) protein
MIKCPVCKTEYPENTLFCEECSSYLQGGNGAETDPLILQGVAVAWAEGEKTQVGEEKPVSPVNLKLSIPCSGREIELLLTEEVNIGRRDSASNFFPEVDLASDGALKEGVSRWHARITRRGGEILIEDRGSINGTFLNGKRLTPYSPEALKSGDELTLGDLVLRTSFQ